MTDQLIAEVKRLITTPVFKDGTDLVDWITEGDTDDMTAQEIATEWDELPDIDISQPVSQGEKGLTETEKIFLVFSEINRINRQRWQVNKQEID